MTLDSAVLLYTYISRFSVNPHYQQTRKIRQSCRHKFYPQLFLVAFFNFSHKRPTFAFTSESGYTLGFRRRIAHSGLHAETGGVSDGGGITTLGAFRTFTNIPGPGIRTASFAAFGAWSGVLPKNAESLRNSDALMRVAVPRRRGPAGLRDPVVRPLMLRFSVSVRKVSAQSPVNATRSSSHLNPSTTQPSSKNRTQRLARRNVCAFDVAILEVSCYTDGHRKPLKNFFNFFENRVRNGAARASI